MISRFIFFYLKIPNNQFMIKIIKRPNIFQRKVNLNLNN